MKPIHLAPRRSMAPLSPVARDVLFAAALTGLTQLELWVSRSRVEGPMALQAASFAVATMAVAGRRRAPLAASLLNAGALAIQTVLGGNAPVSGGFVAFVLLAYAVAAHASTTRAVIGLSAMASSMLTYPVVHRDARSAGDFLGNAAILVGAWSLGLAMRNRRRRTVELETHAEALELDREAAMRAAVHDERTRIARELHDIVAHSVSVMVLQAGAARQVLEQDPARARTSLLTVEDSGRQALDELHRLLGILRRDAAGLVLDPPAGLGQLDALVDQLAAAGLPVRVVREGRAAPLSPGADLSAYRIVQEALTNALKHAGAGSVEVLVRYLPDALELEIRDDGANPAPRGGGGGHGLVGMRERVGIFGGTLEAGPMPDGGWRVHARLPSGAAFA